MSSAEAFMDGLGANGIARLSRAQLAGFQQLIAHIPEQVRMIVVLAHHPIAARADEQPTMRAYLALLTHLDENNFDDAFLRHDVSQAQHLVVLVIRLAAANRRVFLLFGLDISAASALTLACNSWRHPD